MCTLSGSVVNTNNKLMAHLISLNTTTNLVYDLDNRLSPKKVTRGERSVVRMGELLYYW